MELSIASDYTHRHSFTVYETQSMDIIDLALKYGRAEAGELVSLMDDEDNVIASAWWDEQTSKYRRR